MSNALELITRGVNEFHNWLELPKHGRLSPKLMLEITDERRWEDPYLVAANLVGVYIFENQNGEPYYVGSVSANSSFGYRFANGYVSKDPDDATKAKYHGQANDAKRIFVVEMPREYAFVAPALEQFLITYLNTGGNSKDGINALNEVLDPNRLDTE